MTALNLEGITLRFAGVTALDRVSLAVPTGPLLAVIGPNGAGKTSLFNCISGVYAPQRGRVEVLGTDVSGRSPEFVARLGVARMFQNLALFDNLTVLENLMLGRHLRFRTSFLQDLLWTRSAREQEVTHRRRAEEVIEFLDLERFRASYVATLPYGVLKRVELGRALCMDPRLLLLDEPAAGLNQEETEDMARYILDIKEELGVTILLIEHELRFVLELADRVAVLDFGGKIADGTPEEIKDHPRVLEAYLGGPGEGTP